MEVTRRFLSNVQHTYDSKQKLVEKYDVSSTGTGGGGGEYPLQDGFGWTNGVTLKMLDPVLPAGKKPCDAPAGDPADADRKRHRPTASRERCRGGCGEKKPSNPLRAAISSPRFSIDVTPSSARQPAKCLLALREDYFCLIMQKANDNNSHYFFNEKKHFVYFRGGAQGVPDRAIQDYGMISSVYFKRSALVCALAAAFPLAAQAEDTLIVTAKPDDSASAQTQGYSAKNVNRRHENRSAVDNYRPVGIGDHPPADRRSGAPIP